MLSSSGISFNDTHSCLEKCDCYKTKYVIEYNSNKIKIKMSPPSSIDLSKLDDIYYDTVTSLMSQYNSNNYTRIYGNYLIDRPIEQIRTYLIENYNKDDIYYFLFFGYNFVTSLNVNIKCTSINKLKCLRFISHYFKLNYFIDEYEQYFYIFESGLYLGLKIKQNNHTCFICDFMKKLKMTINNKKNNI
jgi:hypothetical protein